MKPKMIFKALRAIDKTFKFEVTGKGEIIWLDDRKQPSFDEIKAKIKEIEIEELKKLIEKIATNIVKQKLNEYEYDNEGEVALYATNNESIWHDEAKAFQRWIENVYKKMYDYQNLINENNYKNIDIKTFKFPEFKI